MAARELIDLADCLNGYAGAIDDFIAAQANPFDGSFVDLRASQGQIAGAANLVAALALAGLAPEIAAATAALSAKVTAAQAVLKDIEAIEKNLQLAAAVLAVAAAVSTGDPFGTVTAVNGLVVRIDGAL
ncbi:hypothetical protein GCM10011611_35190 [Aliidongia dinghuensis]|uniref:Uncharacterized protein n=1 Tax=Aliidongia dinghuensis TaxID=1867774 RepID=A0A8J2YV77_9PROT|nr:hypothetical protein [Aliidongia dinghuensis]GGF26106.1 hypothetical protein GCM10011611_35190 [Aliidongia dinghuensis]